MSAVSRPLFYLAAAALLSACANLGVRSDSPAEQVVWADDDSGLLLVLPEQDSKATSAALRSRHRLILQSPDGLSRQPVGTPRPYLSGEAYYMKTAGYLVVESLLDDGRVRFDKITPDGNEITIIETRAAEPACDGDAPLVKHSVIPSPDGEWLAHVFSPDCSEVVVEFLQARDLVTLDSQVLPVQEKISPTWHPGGYLLLAQADGKTAWRFAPEQERAPAPYPRCFNPQTRSSDIAADGRKVSLDQDTLVKFSDPEPARAFGCQ